MIDLYDALDLLYTNKQINVLARSGDTYHMLISGFKDDILKHPVFSDIETHEVDSIIDDENFLTGICIELYFEDDYFTLPEDDDRSGYIDFYQIKGDIAPKEMVDVYNDLGFYML